MGFSGSRFSMYSFETEPSYSRSANGLVLAIKDNAVEVCRW